MKARLCTDERWIGSDKRQVQEVASERLETRFLRRR
jgi:hypothetical protein